MKTLNCDQGSPEWKKARLEKISGTRLGSAVGSKAVQETLLNELIAERLSGEPKEIYKSAAMYRGTEAESYALDLYEERAGNIVKEVGMLISEEYDFLSCSPDGLIGEDGAIEIKSPAQHTSVKYIRDEKIPMEYYHQCMAYFLVNDKLKWLDFSIYTPQFFDERYQLVVQRIYRPDAGELNDILKKVLQFKDVWQEELIRLDLEF